MPEVRTFTTALTACARENQLNRALSLVERMYQLEVAPDVATYNVLLQACEKQGKHEVVEQLIQQMPELGVEPNIVNYNTAVRSLLSALLGSEIFISLLSALLGSEIFISHLPYLADALAESWRRARQDVGGALDHGLARRTSRVHHVRRDDISEIAGSRGSRRGRLRMAGTLPTGTAPR